MKVNLFYGLNLFLACLAALLLGYAASTYLEENHPSETVSVGSNAATWEEVKAAYPEVEEYDTLDAMGYRDYNEYEAHVMEQINDR